jgi:hypothetical protein
MAEIETSRELSRADVAAYLREFADQLDARGTPHSDGVDDTARDRRDTTTGRSATPETQADDRGTNVGVESGTETQERTAAQQDTTTQEPTSEADGDSDTADVGHGTRYEKVTFFVGNDSATINPPETMTLDVAVDSDSAMLSSANRRSVDFHLEWDTDAVDDEGELHIE